MYSCLPLAIKSISAGQTFLQNISSGDDAVVVKSQAFLPPNGPVRKGVLSTDLAQEPQPEGNLHEGATHPRKSRETKGRFCKRVVLANVSSLLFLYQRSVLYTLVPFLGAILPFIVPSFRFWGSREHPPKPPFWKPH